MHQNKLLGVKLLAQSHANGRRQSWNVNLHTDSGLLLSAHLQGQLVSPEKGLLASHCHWARRPLRCPLLAPDSLYRPREERATA